MFKIFTRLSVFLILVGFTAFAQQKETGPSPSELENMKKYGITLKSVKENNAIRAKSRRSSATVANSYCPPPGIGCTGQWVSYVGIVGTTLDNTTGCDNTSTGYTAFDPANANQTASLNPGASYDLKVGVAGGTEVVSCWIDYDQDNVFAPNEWIDVTRSAAAGSTLTVNFTVPATAVPGQTGMRIRSRLAGNTNDSTSACLQFYSGEAEDYTITIVPTTALLVTSFSPLFGQPGDLITINGYNFTGGPGGNVLNVKFNGLAASSLSTTILSANQLTAIVPRGATTGPISVVNSNQTSTTRNNFHIGGFHIDSIVPAAARPGYPVLIYCADGIRGIIPQIDGVDFENVQWDDNLLAYKARVPVRVSAPTPGIVTIGTGALQTTAPKPLVIVPGAYCVPSSPACLTFSNSISEVSISNTTFDNVSACNDGLYTNTIVYAPSRTTTAKFTFGQTFRLNVTTTGSALVSAWVDFNNDGNYDSTEYFRVSNFSTAGVPASVNITVPPTAASGDIGLRIRTNYSFTATGAATTACSSYNTGESEDYLITIGQPTSLLLTDFTPNSGIVGDKIILNGYFMNTASGASFNGMPATIDSVIGGNAIRVIVPRGATTGPVSVFNATDTSTSLYNFFVGPFQIDSVTPAAARPGYPVVIYSPNGLDGFKPKIDGVDFDNVVWNQAQNFYTAIVPSHVNAGVVTLGSGNAAGRAPRNLFIVDGTYCVPQNPYCTPGGAPDIITNVTIDNTTLNNSSTCIPHLTFNSEVYANRGNSTAKLYYGLTYNLSVTTSSNNVISVWFDFNQNGVYEASEWTRVTASSTANQPNMVQITMPSAGPGGQLPMRIRSRASGAQNAAADACTQFYSGESEDYLLSIENPSKMLITDFDPVFGVSGDSVTINGFHLDRASTVKFNGTAVISNIDHLGTTRIKVKVPPLATTGRISVTNATEGDTSFQKFYVGGFHLDSITPAAARAGYPVFIFSHDGIRGLKPKCDGIVFDNITFDPIRRGYQAIVPQGASAGVVTLGSGGSLNTAPRNLEIVPGAYCVPISTPCGTYGSFITNVNIANTTLDNNSVCNDGLYYNSIVYAPKNNATTFIIPGQTYTLNVTPNVSCSINAWIDFNGNGTYDTSEYVNVGQYVQTGTVGTAQFTVPANARSGKVGFRVRTNYTFSGSGANTSSCNAYPYYSGESEDYVLTVGIPPSIYITGFTPAYGGPGTVVTLTGYHLDSVNTIKFNNGVAVAPLTGGTATSITVTVPAGATTGFITAIGTGSTAISRTRFFVGTAKLFDTAQSVRTCSDFYVDHIAPNTTYAPSQDIIKTFTPLNPTQGIHIDWVYFNLRRPNDYVEVYDGADVAATQIGVYTGSALPPNIVASNTTGQITLHFVSDTGVGNSGFGFNVSCGAFPPAPPIDSIVPAAARPGYPFVIYSPIHKDGIDPMVDDSLFIDNLTYNTAGRYYTGLVPYGVRVGKVSIKSGVNESVGHIQILPYEYCAPLNGPCTALPGTDDITKVSITGTTLNNSSDCERNYLYNVIAYPAVANNTADLTRRNTYSLNVTTNYNNIISVWFDWNQDAQYTADEWMQIATTTVNGRVNTIQFTVPDTAKLGLVSMRIRSSNPIFPNGPEDACSDFNTGETEEYLLNIKARVGVTPMLTGSKTGIYPNPNNGQFTLNLSDLGNEGTIRITDALGRVVYTRALTSADAVSEAKFDAAFLNSGVYSVEVNSGNKRAIERMVISK